MRIIRLIIWISICFICPQLGLEEMRRDGVEDE